MVATSIEGECQSALRHFPQRQDIVVVECGELRIHGADESSSVATDAFGRSLYGGSDLRA